MTRSFDPRILCLVVAAVFMTRCGSDNGGGTTERPYENVHLDLFTVAPLPAGMMYELWAAPPEAALTAHEEDWVSLARFNVNIDDNQRRLVDESGVEISNNDLEGLPADLEDFDSLFVTVEPHPDNDSLPSGIVYLRGEIGLPSHAIVSMRFPAEGLTAPNEFAIASFITPTDTDTSNELSGVWFLAGDFTPSLFSLPLPPPGWIYEGWAIRGATALSTGQFADYTAADDGNPYSSNEVAPPDAPGEDFLMNPPPGVTFPFTFTQGDEVAVTVEPDAVWDPAAPFPYKIFVSEPGEIPQPGQPHNLDALGDNIFDEAFPVAQALITRPPE